jgi:integrase
VYDVPTGCIRERNGRFYIRTRVYVVDPKTGQSRWKQIERAAGTNRRKAQLMLRNLQSSLDQNRFVPAAGLTVSELGARWLAEHVNPNLKPGAAASYRTTFHLHVAPVLGPTKVEDCTPQMIRTLLGRKRAAGMSEEGVAKVRRQIHALFAYAQDLGVVAVNPADVPRARGRRAPHRRARGTELTPVQIERFLAACSPRWRRFFTVALDTGLRRGELIGLQWGDIDLLQRIVHVRRSIGPYDDPEDLVDAATKTEAGKRLVPILDGALQALEEQCAQAADTGEATPVFPTVEKKPNRVGATLPPGRPLCPRMVSRVFRRYADRAGLPATIRLHDLRHTAITNAISQGEDILLISAFAGHAKTSTTLDIYAHLMPDRVKRAAFRMRSVSAADRRTSPPELPARRAAA